MSLIQVKAIPKSDVFEFCTYFVARYGLERVRHPEFLALSFRQFYGLTDKLTLQGMAELALQKAGVSEIGSMPSYVQGNGWHFRFGRIVQILLRDTDPDHVKAFTLAHELREIIGEICSEFHPRFQDEVGMDMEAAADIFASTLIFGEEAFSIQLTKSGFDPVWLSETYHMAPNSIIRRMVQTLRGWPDSPFFWISTLSYQAGIPNGYLISRGSYRTPSFNRSARDKSPNNLFPKRGQLVPIKGFLRQAFKYGQTVYIHRVTGLDHWNHWCLSIIIRPIVRPHSSPTLLIIGIPTEHSDWIHEQIGRVRPLLQEESFQLN
jgi:hypothetical protein